ncbi:tail length tape measure protein [Bacillus phage Glittering]|uniref:Tape measure protein n=1 Tax=Bacillus phage Glittering TaxID=2884421 RepID=U5PX90_9CAUD|nr:tail length tape measure protein [Bacillus phage Glittering]AGY47212.1 tape measure protein [Bacillus phage Glittering]
MASNSLINIVVSATDMASAQIGKVGGALEGMANKAERASAIITGVLAMTAAAFVGVAAAGFKTNSELESSFARWKTLTGSVKGANQQLKWTQDYAKASPFDFKGVDETATSLKGMGLEIKDIRNYVPILGDVAAVLGGGTETVKGLGVAIGQMNAKGKVSAEEMMQLAERGVPAWQFLADAMGLSVAEVQKLGSEGKLLAKDAIPMIMAGMKKTFGGGTQEYMKTTKGQFENLTESAQQFAGQLTQPAYTWLGTTVLPALNTALDDLQSKFSGGLLSGFQQLFSSAWAAPMILLAGVITGALIGGIMLIAPAVAGAVIAFLPFIAIGTAIAALAALVIANWSNLQPVFAAIGAVVKPVFDGLMTGMQQAGQILISWLMPAFESFKQAFVTLQPLITAVGIVLGVLLAAFVATFAGVIAAIGPVITAIGNILNVVANVVMGVIALFTGDFAGAMTYFGAAWDNLVLAIMNVFKGLVNFFAGTWNAISAIFSNFGVNIASTVSSMVSKVVSFFTSLGSRAKSIWNSLKSSVISIVTSLASSAISKFVSMGSKVVSTVVKFISSIVKSFTSLPSKVASALSSLAGKLSSTFTSAMSRGKSAVTKGISSIIGAIKGWIGKFTSSGKGLLDAFTKGIKSGISGAIGAVKKGMSSIRKFLPFSPAKEGPLKDLDKSGESFFPTWYEAALKKVSPMTKAVGGAMSKVSDAIQTEQQGVSLGSFTGGRSSITVVHKHEHEGTIKVNGDNGSEALQMAGQEIFSRTERDVFGSLRSTVRKL